MHEMHNRWKFTHAKKTTGIYKVTYSNGMTLDNLPTYYIFYLTYKVTLDYRRTCSYTILNMLNHFHHRTIEQPTVFSI